MTTGRSSLHPTQLYLTSDTRAAAMRWGCACRYSKFDAETGQPTHDKDGQALEGKVRARCCVRGCQRHAHALQHACCAGRQLLLPRLYYACSHTHTHVSCFGSDPLYSAHPAARHGAQCHCSSIIILRSITSAPLNHLTHRHPAVAGQGAQGP